MGGVEAGEGIGRGPLREGGMEGGQPTGREGGSPGGLHTPHPPPGGRLATRRGETAMARGRLREKATPPEILQGRATEAPEIHQGKETMVDLEAGSQGILAMMPLEVEEGSLEIAAMGRGNRQGRATDRGNLQGRAMGLEILQGRVTDQGILQGRAMEGAPGTGLEGPGETLGAVPGRLMGATLGAATGRQGRAMELPETVMGLPETVTELRGRAMVHQETATGLQETVLRLQGRAGEGGRAGVPGRARGAPGRGGGRARLPGDRTRDPAAGEVSLCIR